LEGRERKGKFLLLSCEGTRKGILLSSSRERREKKGEQFVDFRARGKTQGARVEGRKGEKERKDSNSFSGKGEEILLLITE